VTTEPDSVGALAQELESVAERLRSGTVGQEEAAQLVERCAELAGRLGSEIDSRARIAGEAEGQERLL
jgi:hypothetical protein